VTAVPRPFLPIVAAALIVLPRGGGALPGEAGGGARAALPEPAPAAAGFRDLRSEVGLRRAVRWLLAQQQEDGSWRSPQYGVLKSGQAYTPFVLHALLSAPPASGGIPESAVARALGFIRSMAGEDGALGYRDPDVLEYPVYATSYALRAMVLAAPRDPLVARMARWLAAMQLAEPKGFDPRSPAYGGWSFGVRTLPPGIPGHTDLAHTRRALEALRDAKALDATVRDRALRLLGLVQKRAGEIERFPGVPGFEDVRGAVPCDGGFFFSPIVLVANKALHEKPAGGHAAFFRSYATATADGALALVAAGVRRSDERLASARAWLSAHAAVDPGGIPADHPEPWIVALRFYHLAAFAEAASALDLDGDWRQAFTKRLAGLQRPDGSFANDGSALMKEDDPILATTFAIVAWTHLERRRS
jgi:hypothetical protein